MRRYILKDKQTGIELGIILKKVNQGKGSLVRLFKGGELILNHGTDAELDAMDRMYSVEIQEIRYESVFK